MPKEKIKHLGRGLEALISPITSSPDRVAESVLGETFSYNISDDKKLHDSYMDVSIDVISPNPYQVRSVWDEKELANLADSIKSNGVIQPIIVRPNDGGYQIIAGERRFRAAKMASMETIPALVRKASDEQLLELALVENIHRSNLNPIERAKAYQNYLKTFSITQAQASQRLGEDRSVIANHIRLLELPDEIKQMLVDGQLSMGHARAILGLANNELQRKLANRALAGRLSVREVERLVRRYTSSSSRSTVVVSKPAHIVDLENKLSNQLGTKVHIETRKNGQRGNIVIEFYSLDEFDRITETIGLTTAQEV
ncbi:MAG: ParB/RepB/Spo0J family partition protein [Sedimentisphaerales bacterium]|nr:ParB/RepB/Spo0J family partition protein [Sedimentisphaerales bacterium]